MIGDSRVRTAGTVTWLVVCLLCLSPLQARAQESIRVVEAVSAATGERQRYVIRDLEAREIRALQSALREAGYVGIGWTGRLDDGTVRGLTRFQGERGLVECGCVSYETVVALGIRPEVVATVATEPGGTTAASTTGDASTDASGLHSGILYPVGIPIYVPWPPPCDADPCEGEAPAAGGDPPATPDARAPARGGTGSVASPPGVRPPPPGSARAPSSGSPR
ncbi:MAG: peptidoglycan-binding protein [marine benthic group bacterium]|nr:peptidoglycan-binding protein [Gemmatimonadota bacterium]